MDLDPFADSPFAGRRRVLFVHAHPDDETIATGALIAGLLDAGRRCFVLTATRGEQGESRAGTLAPGGDLVAFRVAEWRAAGERLGVQRSLLLGTPPARAPYAAPRRYSDSGMAWLDAAETVAGPGREAGPDALTAADPAEVAADIVACARELGADVLVSYDALGGYGHPDHVFLNEPTRAAASRLRVPFVEIMSTPKAPGDGATWLDLSGYHDATAAALREYASQLDVQDGDIVHVGGQRMGIPVQIGVREDAAQPTD